MIKAILPTHPWRVIRTRTHFWKGQRGGMVRSKTVMSEMLFAVFMLSVIRSAGSQKPDECPAKQEMSCESLRTTEGYTFPVPLNIPGSRDCEHAWYLPNGTCIVHSDGKGNMDFVVAVTLENLTVSACEDLQWELRCDSIQFHCTIKYTVIKPEEKQDENHKAGLPDWGTALIVIGIVGALITVWFYCRKAKNRAKTSEQGGVV